MELFDTHAHYDAEQFDPDREELLQQMASGGVGTIVFFALMPRGSAIVLGCPFLLSAIILLLCTLHVHLSIRSKERNSPYSGLPLLALSLDALCAISLSIGSAMIYISSGLFDIIGLLLILSSILAPIAGIVCGIITLADKQRRSRGAVAASIIAIALPVIAAATVILLFSTGVFVINLM